MICKPLNLNRIGDVFKPSCLKVSCVVLVSLAWNVSTAWGQSGGETYSPEPVEREDSSSQARTGAFYDKVLLVSSSDPKEYFPVFEPITIEAEGLNSPDGLAVHPLTGEVFVSEENTSRIGIMVDHRFVPVIDGTSPVYREGDTKKRTDGITQPEGIAFSPEGDLYVVEDRPGGRLLRFRAQPGGRSYVGEELRIPGTWNHYAWEGIDVGPKGELLLAGSDLEHVGEGDGLKVFNGAILYRDPDGIWWLPLKRFFASFTSVAFSRAGRSAAYVCELSGEVGWIDLRTQRPYGGTSSMVARSPEGVCLLPNGLILVAEEGGTVYAVDPSTDRHEMVLTGLSQIESVVWDHHRRRILITEDGTGRVLSARLSPELTSSSYKMDRAVFYPYHSRQFVPDSCPHYLARVLALGGLDYTAPNKPELSFKEFTTRIPLVAADVAVIAMDGARTEDDPVERIQFVVFEPNTLTIEATGVSMSLAAFSLRTRSGQLVQTSLMPMRVQQADILQAKVESIGPAMFAVPRPSAIMVSPMGIATIQFLGFGRTPDYALVLNPRCPTDSYMMVVHPDGSRYHYRLALPGAEETLSQWIIAYSNETDDQWPRLSFNPREAAEIESEPVDRNS